MGAADNGMDDPSLSGVKREIERVFSDTSVPPEETIERMKVIIETCQENVQAMEEMIEDEE